MYKRGARLTYLAIRIRIHLTQPDLTRRVNAHTPGQAGRSAAGLQSAALRRQPSAPRKCVAVTGAPWVGSGEILGPLAEGPLYKRGARLTYLAIRNRIHLTHPDLTRGEKHTRRAWAGRSALGRL